MSRRTATVILVIAAFACMAEAWQEPVIPPLDQTSDEYLLGQLVTSKKPDEASMDEISARLAWVLSDHKLPDEARYRTELRARSTKADKIGPIGFREDVAPTKRNLCFAILKLDDKLRSQ